MKDAQRPYWNYRQLPHLSGFVRNGLAIEVKAKLASALRGVGQVAKPTDIDADLTFEISGSAVTPERFQRAMSAFFDLLSEVTKAVAPEGARVEWRVQVKQGSNLVGVLPAPGVSDVVAASVREAIVTGLERLEREPAEPFAFSEQALTSVRRLAAGLGTHEDDDTQINVWGQRAPVPITRHLGANVIELLREAYADEGSVEGRLKTVSEAGSFRIVLYEPVFERPVRCLVPEHLIPQALALFGKRVEAYGVVSYRRDGAVSRVAVKEIVPLPSEKELPSHEQVYGILRSGGA